MPHIEPNMRPVLKENPAKATTGGHLNYLYTLHFINGWKQKTSYQTYHDFRKHKVFIVGRVMHDTDGAPFDLFDHYAAFDNALGEFDRRVVSKYEDSKAYENGDVYEEEFMPTLPATPEALNEEGNI